MRGTVIAINGGGRGIGAAAARMLAARGARVAIGDVDAEAAAAVAAELPGCVGLGLDVTDTESHTRFLDEVTARLGPVEVFVANAGVMWVGPFDQEPEAARRRQVAVNLEGVIRGIQLVTPMMRRRGRGHIVVVASAASKVAPAGEATYAATKHGVYGYCTAVREELRGSGVELSVLMPTVASTALAAGTSSGKVALLTADEVAQGVLTLVDRRRPEMFLPGRVGIAAAALGLAPARLRAALHRHVIPNQVAHVDPSQRSAYERHALADPDPPGGTP